MSRMVWTCVLLLVACGPAASGPALRFDGERAFLDLRDLVRIGPRPAGSEGAATARALIERRLVQAGWPVERHAFAVLGPDGERLELVNLIARRDGPSASPVIVLGTHYDTKRIPGVRFVGANDGASGVALLLELARALSVRADPPYRVWLVFFDGEEAFGRGITPVDGLYGSKALAARWQQSGELAQVGALIVVDMVADRDLNLTPDLGSSPELRGLLERAAERRGDVVIDARARRIVDDHAPFRELGLEQVLLVIDFQLGDRTTPGPLWHTAGDDLAAVSAASLNRSGGLVVEALGELEGWLEARARAPGGAGR